LIILFFKVNSLSTKYYHLVKIFDLLLTENVAPKYVQVNKSHRNESELKASHPSVDANDTTLQPLILVL